MSVELMTPREALNLGGFLEGIHGRNRIVLNCDVVLVEGDDADALYGAFQEKAPGLHDFPEWNQAVEDIRERNFPRAEEGEDRRRKGEVIALEVLPRDNSRGEIPEAEVAIAALMEMKKEKSQSFKRSDKGSDTLGELALRISRLAFPNEVAA
jgi:hypothetical protein